jgi:hypothetical protein
MQRSLRALIYLVWRYCTDASSREIGTPSALEEIVLHENHQQPGEFIAPISAWAAMSLKLWKMRLIRLNERMLSLLHR